MNQIVLNLPISIQFQTRNLPSDGQQDATAAAPVRECGPVRRGRVHHTEDRRRPAAGHVHVADTEDHGPPVEECWI